MINIQIEDLQRQTFTWHASARKGLLPRSDLNLWLFDLKI